MEVMRNMLNVIEAQRRKELGMAGATDTVSISMDFTGGGNPAGEFRIYYKVQF